MESRVLKTGPTATGQYEATFRPDSCTILKNYKRGLGDPDIIFYSWVIKKKKHCSEKKTKFIFILNVLRKGAGCSLKEPGP